MNEHMKKLTIGANIAGGLAAAPALYGLKFESPNHVVDVNAPVNDAHPPNAEQAKTFWDKIRSLS